MSVAALKGSIAEGAGEADRTATVGGSNDPLKSDNDGSATRRRDKTEHDILAQCWVNVGPPS